MHIDTVGLRQLNGRPAEPGVRRSSSESDRTKATSTDRVEWSSDARGLAESQVREGWTPTRIQDVRLRIEQGLYNQPAYVSALAWKLIEAGIV